MLVWTMDKDGAPGHPTRRLDWVRKMLRRKKARMIGGGASGKPPILVLKDRSFDLRKTVPRRFVLTLDTGFGNIGFAICEVLGDGLRILVKGTLKARTPVIRSIMDDRRMYRRRRRYLRRKKVRDRGWIPKHRPPRYENRRKRMSATLAHGLRTHLNLIAKLMSLCPLPPHQVIHGFEDASFDVRALIYGKPARGSDYQVSPVGRRQGERKRSYVIRRDGGCIVCGSMDDIQVHHLRKRSANGSNRPANLVALCSDCHEAVHAGLISLPIRGGAAWWDMSNVNAVCGLLRSEAGKRGLHSVPAGRVAAARKALGLPKAHDWDAVACAAALSGVRHISPDGLLQMELAQYRRHNRARIHAERDRLYKLNGKIVARNRRKRTDQREPSLREFMAENPKEVGRLKVYPAVRLRRSCNVPAMPGDVWIYKGRRFVAHGIKDGGRNVHSPALKEIAGKTYAPVRLCRRIIRNEGLAVSHSQWESGSSLP